MEDLPPRNADRKWKVLESASLEEFAAIELKLLKLIVSYCCYFSKGFLTPSATYRASSRQAYYSLVRKITQEGKLRCGNTKLSSIIKDRTLAEIVQLMED